MKKTRGSRKRKADSRVSVESVQPADHLENETVLRPYQHRWANDSSRFALAVKSAQIGYSTATMARYVEKCLARPRPLVILLSRSERQSLELAEKAKSWIDGYRGVAANFFPGQPFGDTSILQHEIHFPNRSRIIALPANPDKARGYTGDVVLDEFAFHKDSEAIFTAVFRQITLNYEMRAISTPNGQRGKFYELAKGLGLDTGLRPERQPVRVSKLEIRNSEFDDAESEIQNPKSKIQNPWSGHWCDVYLAVAEGAPIDIESIQAACDEETWRQEYCCEFLSQRSERIPAELFQQCVSSEASTNLVGAGLRPALGGSETRPYGSLYAGWDVRANATLL